MTTASNHINTNEDFKSSSRCKILSEEELVDIELDWIGGLKEQLEFLNAAMKHHCISFKVQKREFVIGGTP
jgi:hypothetical protein